MFSNNVISNKHNCLSIIKISYTYYKNIFVCLHLYVMYNNLLCIYYYFTVCCNSSCKCMYVCMYVR